MKTLLNQTLKTFSIYSFFILVLSVPAYYFLVDNIWLNEIDENNELIAYRIQEEINNAHLTDVELEKSLFLWDKIQPHTNLKRLNTKITKPDSVYTFSRQNPYVQKKDVNRFRGLSKVVRLNRTFYLLTVETIVEESHETVWALGKLTILFFFLLIAGFLILNRRLSYKLWKPFRHTLSQLKSFQLNNQSALNFEATNTIEFEELNGALTKLIDQNISTYKTQKEFTENASHEIQTPLALIKGKLDLLLQQDGLTESHYKIIEEINRALTRVSRINKNLLLLAKIENSQFDRKDNLEFSSILLESIFLLEEHFAAKKLIVSKNIKEDVIVSCNGFLIEILVNNLLLNTIKHSAENSFVNIVLDEASVKVSNSGFEPLDSGRLYSRFATLSEKSSSSGLGLAIIKQICEANHWIIEYNYADNLHSFSIKF